MPTELPIACSLSAAEMPARLAEMAAIGRTSLLDTETSGRSARLRFRDELGARERLAALVAAESECCAFLTMRLVDASEAITLTIEGPGGAERVIDELVRAFENGTAAARAASG
jgi:hypothetical protein